MRSFRNILGVTIAVIIVASSCNNTEDKNPGTFAIVFDNSVGEEEMILRAPGEKAYDYTDINGQTFNLSRVGYYISEISFSGPSGTYTDPQKITTDPSKLTGFYHVRESNVSSQKITIDNIPPRGFDKVRFRVGIKSYTVIDGPPGGILDPTNGSWFLNMEAGFVNLSIEGNAANSGQEDENIGTEGERLQGTFAINLNGWKDVAPEPGEDAIFINNTKVVELNFDQLLSVEAGLNPEAHINVDIAEIIQGIDFAETFAVKSPSQSSPFSNKFEEAFILDFVTQ